MVFDDLRVVRLAVLIQRRRNADDHRMALDYLRKVRAGHETPRSDLLGDARRRNVVDKALAAVR